MIPNHRYKQHSSNQKDKQSKEIAGYLSTLRDKILDNLEVDIEHIKVSFCDDGGHYPSIIWLCIRRVKVNNLKEQIKVDNNNDSESYCSQCEYGWRNSPAVDKNHLEVKKKILLDGISLYVEDISKTDKSKSNNTNNNNDKVNDILSPNSIRNNAWNSQFSKTTMYNILDNLNIIISISISKTPDPHLHFCYIDCCSPINIKLRDIDIQAFCVLLNELKSLFLVRFLKNIYYYFY